MGDTKCYFLNLQFCGVGNLTTIKSFIFQKKTANKVAMIAAWLLFKFATALMIA